MYFKSREAAGNLLAGQLAKKYRHQKCVVVALDDGGAVVGMQIAKQLHTIIMMLLTEDVELPREPDPIGGVTMTGDFSLNDSDYSAGELDDMVSEYHNFIEQEKMRRVHAMNRANSEGTLFRRDLLEDHVVILVSEGFEDGFTLDLALKFLKPIRTKALVVAAPLASVSAVDLMHIKTDDIFCLNVLEEFISVGHYYDAQDIPDHEVIIKTIDHVVSGWHMDLGQEVA